MVPSTQPKHLTNLANFNVILTKASAKVIIKGWSFFHLATPNEVLQQLHWLQSFVTSLSKVSFSFKINFPVLHFPTRGIFLPPRLSYILLYILLYCVIAFSVSFQKLLVRLFTVCSWLCTYVWNRELRKCVNIF